MGSRFLTNTPKRGLKWAAVAISLSVVLFSPILGSAQQNQEQTFNSAPSLFYIVKKGDSLSEILHSLRLFPIYGEDGTLIKTIQMNPKSVHQKGDLIHAGSRIDLPVQNLSFSERILVHPQTGEVEIQYFERFMVTGDTPGLSYIALQLYGDSSDFQKIANWNRLDAPYVIKIGQKLVIREPPRLSKAQGQQKLLTYWRARFGLAAEDYSTPLTRPQPKRSFASLIQELDQPKKDPVWLDSETALNQGKRLYEQKKLRSALAALRRAKELDPKLIPAWIYEIKTLKALGRKRSERKVASEFLKLHPEFQGIPPFSSAGG